MAACLKRPAMFAGYFPAACENCLPGASLIDKKNP
jgi:hypothetical protein